MACRCVVRKNECGKLCFQIILVKGKKSTVITQCAAKQFSGEEPAFEISQIPRRRLDQGFTKEQVVAMMESTLSEEESFVL